MSVQPSAVVQGASLPRIHFIFGLQHPPALFPKGTSYTQSSVSSTTPALLFIYSYIVKKTHKHQFPSTRVDVSLFLRYLVFFADPEFPSFPYIYNSRKTPVRCGLQIIHRYW